MYGNFSSEVVDADIAAFYPEPYYADGMSHLNDVARANYEEWAGLAHNHAGSNNDEQEED